MACPRDCQVDQWNSWGFCLPTQCPEHSTGIEREQRGNVKYRMARIYFHFILQRDYLKVSLEPF